MLAHSTSSTRKLPFEGWGEPMLEIYTCTEVVFLFLRLCIINPNSHICVGDLIWK